MGFRAVVDYSPMNREDFRDTEAGGDRRDFPTTAWSTFLTGTLDGAAGRRAIETLADKYWKPVYSYIRAKWSKTNEDAKDRTQDFFVWMIESGFLNRADPARGRFRSFLKVALNHYLADIERMHRSIKRGGNATILAIGRGDDELPEIDVADPAGRTPEQLLDEVWRGEIFGRAVDQLESALKEEGRAVHFEVFRDYFLRNEEKIEYRELAQRYKIGTADVSNHLMYVKKRFRAILTDLVTETVQGTQELEAELKWLWRQSQS